MFVDTSAFYALLDRDDAFHRDGADCWRALVMGGGPLVTHNYVVVETVALVQHRLGVQAARVLNDDVLPRVNILWIDEHLHGAAMIACLASGRRNISLVDWASFEVMRAHAAQDAFAFDSHFSRQGFTVIP